MRFAASTTALIPAFQRCAIPIFFFHLRDGGTLIPDDTGTEFTHIYEAYLDAHRAVDEMWMEMTTEARTATRYAFEITDAAGKHMLELPFSEVVRLPAPSNRTGPLHLGRNPFAQRTRANSRILTAEIATLVICARQTVERSRSVLHRSRKAP